MTKIQIKSEKLTPFGGFFSIMEQFDSILSSVIDSTLGLRCKSFGYRYSEIIRSLMSIYFCGGSCIEDVTTHLMNHLSLHPTYRCILTNDYESSVREIVEFYNLRGGKERIFDDMNNGFGWDRLPKSFMAENTVFLLLTTLIRNFYKVIIQRLDIKRFGLNATSRIKAFVFKLISVPAKWIKTSRRYVLNIYTCNNAYSDVFQTDFG